MALHKTGQGAAYYFFDPNVGEYRFPRADLHSLGLLLAHEWLTDFVPRNYDTATWVEYERKSSAAQAPR